MKENSQINRNPQKRRDVSPMSANEAKASAGGEKDTRKSKPKPEREPDSVSGRRRK